MSQESCFDIDKGAVRVIEMEAPIEVIETNPVITPSPITIFHQFLRQAEPVYAVLMELKEKGWKNSKGDEHFQYQRQRADTATGKAAARFYQMMQEIGDEMQAATGVFCQNNRSEDGVGILDLCMAPGGYTASALKYNPTAKAIGITLPPDKGGHEVFLNSYRSTILYHDITMFAKEFGVDEVPCTHPGHDSFSLERPFIDQRFDFVICDGQVLRKHKRPEYQERTEANRSKPTHKLTANFSVAAHPTWRDINNTIAQDRGVGYHGASIYFIAVLRHRSIQTLEEACDQVDVLSHCKECSAECRICKSGSHCLEEGLVECNLWWGAGFGCTETRDR